jgi:hypothetical protein
LIGTVIALRLLAMSTEGAPAVVDEEPVLTLDPCVEVDETTVREVMELELWDARPRNAKLPTSVSVRCVGDAQEIRVESRSAPEQDEVRAIQLSSVADAAAPAARQARSRELALAIAELIRRREIAPPAPPATPPPPPPPPVVPALVVSPAQPAEAGRWQLGILTTYDYFGGGQRFIGGDLFTAARLGRWFVAELRAGGRVGADQPLPGGRLSARAATVGAAAGIRFWPERLIGFELMLRAQEYLVQFRAEASGDSAARTALLGAFVLAAEPRLIVALARHFELEATAAVGLPPRGIVVRIQGTDRQSMSGLVLSGSLAGVLTF